MLPKLIFMASTVLAVILVGRRVASLEDQIDALEHRVRNLERKETP